MPVTAKFVPDSIELVPGTPTSLSLRLHNSEEQPQVVHLSRSGDLVDHVTLDVDTAAIEPNQIFDIPVTVEVGTNVAAGNQVPSVKLTSECGSVTAALDVAVLEHSEHTVELRSAAITGIVVGTSHRPRRQLRQRHGDRGADPGPARRRDHLRRATERSSPPRAPPDRSRSGSRRPPPTGTGRRRSTRSSSGRVRRTGPTPSSPAPSSNVLGCRAGSGRPPPALPLRC